MLNRDSAHKPVSAAAAATGNLEFAAELAKQKSEVRASVASGSGVQTCRPIRELGGGVQFIPASRCANKRPLDKMSEAEQPARRDKDSNNDDSSSDDEAAKLRASRLSLIAKAALYESLARPTAEGEADAEEDRDGEIDDKAPLVDFVRQRQLERWRDLDKEYGVGHYRFSVDAAERAEQLAALNRRTEQTELAKRRRVEALEKRRDAAAARLERVRQRRGIAAPAPSMTSSSTDAEEVPPAIPEKIVVVEQQIEQGIKEIRRQVEAETEAESALSPWQQRQRQVQPRQRLPVASFRRPPTAAAMEDRNPEFAPPY
uniref:DUF2040 domain-containing protein n=1 Tax=Macrostomum lignano TaxID=282301 RepID=A0A1I8H924_9PLAT